MKQAQQKWEIRLNKGHSVAIVGEPYQNANGVIVQDLVHHSIFLQGDYYRESNAQKIRYARLIQQAPAMLATLQALIANPQDAEAWQQAQSIIAQATGKHTAEDSEVLDAIPTPEQTRARLMLVASNSQPSFKQQPTAEPLNMAEAFAKIAQATDDNNGTLF